MHPVLQTLCALSVLLPVLSALTVGLRFYARSFRRLPFLSDDWLILAAWVLAGTTSGLNLYAVLKLGLGTPPMSHTIDQVIRGYKVIYATLILDYACYYLIKISVIQFYKRIFSMGSLTIWANILIGLITAWTIAGTLAHAFASTPVSNFWMGQFTINWPVLNYTMAAINVVFDIAILLLPVIPIRDLKVSRRQKWSIIGMFWLGFVCTIASIMRIYYAYEFSKFGPATTLSWMRYVTASTNLWLVIESNVSIIAACLPALGGLIRTKVPTLVSSRHGRSGGYILSGTAGSSNREKSKGTTSDDSTWIQLDNVSESRASDHEPESQSRFAHGIRVETTIGWEKNEGDKNGTATQRFPNSMV